MQTYEGDVVELTVRGRTLLGWDPEGTERGTIVSVGRFYERVAFEDMGSTVLLLPGEYRVVERKSA